MMAYIRPWAVLVRGWLRGRSDLVLENAALRQQLAMYDRRRLEVRDSDRLFWLVLVRIWPGWRGAVIAVRPETVVRWQRAGWRRLCYQKTSSALTSRRETLVLVVQPTEDRPTNEAAPAPRRRSWPPVVWKRRPRSQSGRRGYCPCSPRYQSSVVRIATGSGVAMLPNAFSNLL